MENLTYEIGTHLRDTLRTDATILSLLGITALTSKNYVFFTRPTDQVQGFKNPRVVVTSKPSDADELANTAIYQGFESFLVSVWTNDTPFSTNMEILDRIATLFNKVLYTFKSEGSTFNYGAFRCTGKISEPDIDKEETVQGTITITLSIGGNL